MSIYMKNFSAFVARISDGAITSDERLAALMMEGETKDLSKCPLMQQEVIKMVGAAGKGYRVAAYERLAQAVRDEAARRWMRLREQLRK